MFLELGFVLKWLKILKIRFRGFWKSDFGLWKVKLEELKFYKIKLKEWNKLKLKWLWKNIVKIEWVIL